DEAREALTELDELRLARSYYAVEVLRARAWVAIARDDLADARDLLDRAAEVGGQIGDLVGALDALHTLARLGRALHARLRVRPALRPGPPRSTLTPAETAAARLAAAGWSNKEIAAKLHLSVRTVEGQLQRTYEKLSIARRSQLASALQAHGRLPGDGG